MVSESRGVLAGPKRERGGQDDVAGAEPLRTRRSPRPGFPTDQQVLDGVPGADLAALLLNHGGQGPANTSVMAPFKARCTVWAGVAESGQQPEWNERE